MPCGETKIASKLMMWRIIVSDDENQLLHEKRERERKREPGDNAVKHQLHADRRWIASIGYQTSTTHGPLIDREWRRIARSKGYL